MMTFENLLKILLRFGTIEVDKTGCFQHFVDNYVNKLPLVLGSSLKIRVDFVDKFCTELARKLSCTIFSCYPRAFAIFYAFCVLVAAFSRFAAGKPQNPDIFPKARKIPDTLWFRHGFCRSFGLL